MADAPGNAPVAFSGYSQGGSAAAAAVELAPDYARELDIRAAYAGAPVADVLSVIDKADGHDAGSIGYFFNGLAVRYPKVKDPRPRAELGGQGDARDGGPAVRLRHRADLRQPAHQRVDQHR